MKKEKAGYFLVNLRYVGENGTSEEGINPDNSCDKSYSHYVVSKNIMINFNKIMGYKKDDKPNETASVSHYKSLWGSCLWGHSERFSYELNYYPKGFGIDFFYHDAGEIIEEGDGRYDSNKLKHMTYCERLELKKAFKTLSCLIEKQGAIYAESRIERKGWDFIDFKINKSSDRHWGYGESYHGEAYHNINNMWWCYCPLEKLEIMHHSIILILPPDILKNRKITNRDTPENEKHKRILKENISKAESNFKKMGLTSELQKKVERVYDLFDTSFIHDEAELILHKKWNIYFRLDNVFSINDFDYKLLSYCSFYCADNHFKKTSARCKYIWNRLNRWFKKDFTYKELQIIYSNLGSGANRDLGNKFIEKGLDISLLNGDY